MVAKDESCAIDLNERGSPLYGKVCIAGGFTDNAVCKGRLGQWHKLIS